MSCLVAVVFQACNAGSEHPNVFHTLATGQEMGFANWELFSQASGEVQMVYRYENKIGKQMTASVFYYLLCPLTVFYFLEKINLAYKFY